MKSICSVISVYVFVWWFLAGIAVFFDGGHIFFQMVVIFFHIFFDISLPILVMVPLPAAPRSTPWPLTSIPWPSPTLTTPWFPTQRTVPVAPWRPRFWRRWKRIRTAWHGKMDVNPGRICRSIETWMIWMASGFSTWRKRCVTQM